MTNLRQLVAYNIKQQRRKSGISQAKLAEKAEASTQYIAMIELERKFPSPEMLEKLAAALGIDTLELFTPPPFPAENLKDFQDAMMVELENALTRSINKAVKETVSTVISISRFSDHPKAL